MGTVPTGGSRDSNRTASLSSCLREGARRAQTRPPAAPPRQQRRGRGGRTPIRPRKGLGLPTRRGRRRTSAPDDIRLSAPSSWTSRALRKSKIFGRFPRPFGLTLIEAWYGQPKKATPDVSRDVETSFCGPCKPCGVGSSNGSRVAPRKSGEISQSHRVRV
jgi:hypothetical protein